MVVDPQTLERTLFDDAPDPEEITATREMKKAVRNAIETLSESRSVRS